MRAGLSRLILYVLIVLQSACVADSIEDRRSGQQIVCHDNSKSLAVSNADAFGHLQHGDAAGPCPEQN